MKDRDQGAPWGCLVKIWGAPSKNMSCGPRSLKGGPAGLWGHGHQWSEKPSISMSLRGAGSKLVQHYLFMKYLWINMLNYSAICGWLMTGTIVICNYLAC